MATLRGLIRRDNVRAEVEYGDDNPDWPDATPWSVTLRRGRRQLTVPFYTGPAITGEPSAEDVLDCLLSDASSVESARDFEDWCSNLDYDSDSRKDEKIYKACERIREKLQRFLGDDYETYLYAER